MNHPLRRFYSSFLSVALALPFGYWLGGLQGAWTVAVLAVLEVSLSLDNAVVNASVLEGWSQAWRRLFLVFGLPFAVFGMRLIFPVLIVSLVTRTGMGDAFLLAVQHPEQYARALTGAHHMVSAFGGTFLGLVALQFFMKEEKEHHWLAPLEKTLEAIGRYEVAVEVGLVLAALMAGSQLIEGMERAEYVAAGVVGVIVFVTVKVLGELLAGAGAAEVGRKVSQGIGGFLYLEVLDASFSFDGVIGAFAVSHNLFLIMAGLGVGAMFVRSLTLYLVDKGTLGEYRYLEHGAFWAIAALAVIMLVGVKVEIPDTVTGFIGAVLIGLAFWSSVRANKREAAQEVATEGEVAMKVPSA